MKVTLITVSFALITKLTLLINKTHVVSHNSMLTEMILHVKYE